MIYYIYEYYKKTCFIKYIFQVYYINNLLNNITIDIVNIFRLEYKL